MTIAPEKLAEKASKFAAANEMTVVPTIPEAVGGLIADIDPSAMSVDAFLDLARKFGSGLLYLAFRKVQDGLSPSSEFARYAGKVGAVELAFVANGVLHCWEQVTDWFDRWESRPPEQEAQEIVDALDRDVTGYPADASHGDDEGRDDDAVGFDSERYRERQQVYAEYQAMTKQQRDQVIDKLVDLLLANPEFRAAKGDGQRHTIAKQVARSAGVNRWLHNDARNAAVLAAAAAAKEHHDAMNGRLNELAVQLRQYDAYREAAAAAGRKRAVETFLHELADGYWVPGDIRDEVYARAARLSRASSPA